MIKKVRMYCRSGTLLNSSRSDGGCAFTRGASTFLHETTQWPSSWNYDVMAEIRLGQYICFYYHRFLSVGAVFYFSHFLFLYSDVCFVYMGFQPAIEYNEWWWLLFDANLLEEQSCQIVKLNRDPIWKDAVFEEVVPTTRSQEHNKNEKNKTTRRVRYEISSVSDLKTTYRLIGLQSGLLKLDDVW